MREQLKQLINQEQWDQAYHLLQNTGDIEDDESAILACVVYLNQGKAEEAFASIRKGLECNYKNYELWLLLGNYYELKNCNQAWLCYENAEFYCDKQEDLAIISQFKENAALQPGWCVKPASIVILSYNRFDMMKQCLESIRRHNPSSAYELVIVDNASEEPVRAWLEKQSGITLICNEVNQGFPRGCNQGIEVSSAENDIYLLNNDTLLMPNSLFWLRMGLYENSQVGAVGSISNYVPNRQQIKERYQSLDEYESYARRTNLPLQHPYEEKTWLVGFSLLIKREALDKVGMLDVRFSPGNYEDNDLGIRLRQAGYAVRLCHNSFIWHYGHGGDSIVNTWAAHLLKNREKFEEKYGISGRTYEYLYDDMLTLLDAPENKAIKVLEVDCGIGDTLNRIQYLWPQAKVYGIERESQAAEIAACQYEVLQGEIENMELPWKRGTFDYILLGNVLERVYEPKKVLDKLTPYLKPRGMFLCSVSNFMHITVISNLLKGRLHYQDDNTFLEPSYIRFFTLDSIVRVFGEAGLEIGRIRAIVGGVSKEEEALIEYLQGASTDVAESRLFGVSQFVFQAWEA